MKLISYPTTAIDINDFANFADLFEIVDSCKFFSTGKNGDFELRILIARNKTDLRTNQYSLGFGVWNPTLRDIDDHFQTRNDDMRVILATVAQRAIEFLKKKPSALIYAEGSSVARTRLYQREIAKIICEIPDEFIVKGLIRKDDIGFVIFKAGLNYDGFLLSSK